MLLGSTSRARSKIDRERANSFWEALAKKKLNEKHSWFVEKTYLPIRVLQPFFSG